MQKAAPETVHEFLRNFFVAREKTVPRIKSHPTKTRGRWTSTRISLESISSYLSAVCHSSNNARYRRQIFKKTKRKKKFADDKISSIDRLKFFRKYIIFKNIKYQYFFVSKFRNLMNLLFRIYYFEGKERFIKGKIFKIWSLSTSRPFVKKHPLGSIVIDPYGVVQKRAITTNLIVKGGCNSEGVVGHGYRVTGLKIVPVSF